MLHIYQFLVHLSTLSPIFFFALRYNMAIKVSDDGGRSWQAFRSVWNSSAGYSSLFQQADGQVGVLWETEGDQPARGCRIAVA